MTKIAKKTVKQNVEALLGKHEETRGNDKLLQLMYWKEIDKIDFMNFGSEFLAHATPSESITRARRIIQADGRFLPPAEIINNRKDREVNMRNSIVNYGEVI